MLRHLGQPKEAITAFERAIAVAGQNFEEASLAPHVHLNISMRHKRADTDSVRTLEACLKVRRYGRSCSKGASGSVVY